METRRDVILATVSDLVADLLHYGRKEDEDLPQGEIEAAIVDGEITVDVIVEHFADELRKNIG